MAPTHAKAFDVAEENASTQAIQPKRVEEARAHFSKGVSLYEAGDFQSAQSELMKAYELAPSYKLLYNLGLSYRQLNDPASAIRTLEIYLSQGAWEVSDARVAEVTRVISELAPKVASAEIKTNVPVVQISVDDWFAGETPIKGYVVMNPGQHKVTAKREGFVKDSRMVNVNAGDVLTVNFDLRELPPPVAITRLLVLTSLTAIVILLVLRAVRTTTYVGGEEPAASEDASPGGVAAT